MASHDEGHVKRVVALAEYIARREGADVDVVVKAAELHDIARGENGGNHALKGAEIARKLLAENPEFAEKVAHCIEAHSFSSGVKPETIEAKVLSDADKLDAMGAVGIARAFIYSGENGRCLEDTLKHFEEKLLRLVNCLYTETAKELGRERHEFMLEFYKRLKKELEFAETCTHKSVAEQERKNEVRNHDQNQNML